MPGEQRCLLGRPEAGQTFKKPGVSQEVTQDEEAVYVAVVGARRMALKGA